MYEVEEPPTKISKIEMSSHKDNNEGAEEGQEEWLSDDMLTDDDNHEADPDKTDSNLDTSQEELDETFLDETMLSADHSTDSQNMSQGSQADDTREQESNQDTIEAKEPAAESIEQTLNDLENKQIRNDSEKKQAQNILENQQSHKDLENQNQDAVDKQTGVQQTGKSDDNDTDDLLRLLEDNDEKSKKKVLVKTKEKNGASRGFKKKDEMDDDSGSSDDDDYIFRGTAVQKLRMAKSALARKPATKAEPEDFDDETDCSSDETSTLQKIFAVKNAKNSVVKTIVKPTQPTVKQQPVKKVVTIGNTTIEPSKKSTPKRLTNTSQPLKPVLKTISRNTSGPIRTIISNPVRTPSKDRVEKKIPPPSRFDELINEDEFMEEDDFDLDEDFAENSDVDTSRNSQRIMKPEQMEEEIPTDVESQTDSDTMDMYDEVPSPESEDRDDWFSMDIRGERASDYLPLLGDKAHELLSAEKQRVAERLASLRASVAKLHCSGQQQARQLRRAAQALAELDDMLKAS